MRSNIAALRTLVLPFGVTSGTRIVLDGVNGQIELYDASNTLVGLLDSTGYSVLDADGSEIGLSTLGSGVFVYLQPNAVPGHTYQPGFIFTDENGAGTDHQPFISLQSPSVDGLDRTFLVLNSQSASVDASLEVYSEAVRINPTSGSSSVDFVPLPSPGMTYINPKAVGTRFGGTQLNPYLELRSGTVNGLDGAMVRVLSDSNDGALNASVEVTGNHLQLQSGTDLRVEDASGSGGVSVGRGFRVVAASIASSAAAAAEQVVVTIPNVVFRAGRAYRLTIGGALDTSAPTTNTFCRVRIRDTNLAGAVLTDFGAFPTFASGVNAHPINQSVYYRNSTGADITKTVVFTTQNQGAASNASHRGTASSPRYGLIEDVGAASDYGVAAVSI